MALVNPNIAMSFRGVELPQQNALADYAAIQQIQGGRQAQELNALKMQEYERARTEEEGLRNYLAQADLANPQTRAGLARYGKTGLAYGEALTKQDTAALTQREAAFKVQKAKGDFIAQAKRDTSQNPSDANLTAFKEDLLANPLFTEPEKLRLGANVDRILAMPVGERRAFMASQGASASELKPVLTPQTLGGTARILSTPAFGGVSTPVEGSVGTVTAAPAAPPVSVAEFERAKTDPAFMKFLQDRAAATRAPRPEAAPRTQQVTLSDGSLGIVNMDTGVITPSTVGGATAKGKLSPFDEKTAAQKVQMGKDINQAIFELKDAVKVGGLIDKSTGSGAGRLYDVGAGFFGQAPEGAIAAGQLAPIADLVLKMVPRFEGPQSDKDTQSYKAAAGELANPSLPTKIRKAAANEIIRLMEARKNQFGSADMAAPAGGGGVDTNNPLLK
jgi:hypothetical protein